MKASLICFVEPLVSDDEEIFGDFEDLETGEVHKAGASENSQQEGEESDGDETDGKDPEGEETSRIEKKRKQKAAFDAMYPFYHFVGHKACFILSFISLLELKRVSYSLNCI